jgi:hypothetical protein
MHEKHNCRSYGENADAKSRFLQVERVKKPALRHRHVFIDIRDTWAKSSYSALTFTTCSVPHTRVATRHEKSVNKTPERIVYDIRNMFKKDMQNAIRNLVLLNQ